MIGRHECHAALVAIQTFQVKRAVEIDVIEAKDRKPAGKSSRAFEMAPNIGFIQMRGQPGGYGPAQPFIEIAQHDARPVQAPAGHDFFVDQPADLPPLFEVSRAEVNIENVNRFAVELNVGSEAAAGLPAATRADIVVTVALNRKTRQDDVAVPAALVKAVLAKREAESKFVGNILRLIFFGRTPFEADNLLKGNDIGIELTQDLNDAVRPGSAVHSTAFVNVIGSNSKKTAGLGHFVTQPATLPTILDVNMRG
jgi:hypothetical protein